LLGRDRTPGRIFDLYDDPSTPEVYVDGVNATLLGAAVSKIDFHVAVSVDLSEPAPVEIRQLKLRVVIPTAALIEYLGAMLSNLGSNAEPFLAALDQQKSVLAQQLSFLRAQDATKQHPHGQPATDPEQPAVPE